MTAKPKPVRLRCWATVDTVDGEIKLWTGLKRANVCLWPEERIIRVDVIEVTRKAKR